MGVRAQEKVQLPTAVATHTPQGVGGGADLSGEAVLSADAPFVFLIVFKILLKYS